jgi:hypothetical protein
MSLKEKGLLRTGRRRNAHNKQWDNVVYNFKLLLDGLLKWTGEQPLPASTIYYEMVWDDEPQEPEVPLGLVLQVPLKKKSKNNHIKSDGWRPWLKSPLIVIHLLPLWNWIQIKSMKH